MMTCVRGTGQMLALAERHGARFLQASTSEVYGDPEEHPQRETYLGNVSCTGPRACYDEGKRAAETLSFDMQRQGRVDARVARIFNTYGPRMQRDDGRIVSNLIVQALSGADLTIHGTGRQTRSFCFVSDLVAGLLALMEVSPNPGQPVNLGNPDEIRDPGPGRAGSGNDRLRVEPRLQALAAGRPRGAVGRTSRRRRRCWVGAPTCRCGRGLRPRSRISGCSLTCRRRDRGSRARPTGEGLRASPRSG